MTNPEIFLPDNVGFDDVSEIPADFVLDFDAEMSVVSSEWVAWGYEPEVELAFEPHRGRYVATFGRSDGSRGEVAWEPAEPEAQRLAVQWGFRNPIAAARELIEIDRRCRDED